MPIDNTFLNITLIAFLNIDKLAEFIIMFVHVDAPSFLFCTIISWRIAINIFFCVYIKPTLERVVYLIIADFVAR